MRIYVGTTRIVVCVGERAYKIARFRPIRPLVRAVQLLYRREVDERMQLYDQSSKTRAVLKYLLAGVYANRTESSISSVYGSEQLSPVRKQLAYGLVVVQDRGIPIPAITGELKNHPFWEMMIEEKKGDQKEALTQFAFFPQQKMIKLVDYGTQEMYTRLCT